MNKLHVITVIFNPQAYEAIYRNYARFSANMQANSRVILHTVECAFSDRPFRVTEYGHPNHVLVRSDSVLWIKENLINVGLSRLPPDAKEVAWIDADVDFLNPTWAEDTILALDHYHVVQPWSEAIYGGPQGEHIGNSKSFMSQYASGAKWPDHPPRYGELWHPGFAWAARQDALTKLGGLFDHAIVGHGDSHMAQALIGRAEESVQSSPGAEKRGSLSEAYRNSLRQWQARAERHIRRNVGFVSGMIRHHWHGRQVDRKYEDRWAVPVDNNYDPTIHLVRNTYGVYEWSEHHGIGLRDTARNYFRGRCDDANTRN